MSCSAQLLDLYDQASKDGILGKSPDRLLVRMKNDKLSLEKRGFWAWCRRVILKRADTEYNFLENLTEFQKLIDGSLVDLVDLNIKNISPENVSKIEKMITIYNNILLSKKEKHVSTRLEQYINRIYVPDSVKKPEPFSVDRVIGKIPRAREDPALRWIGRYFKEPQSISAQSVNEHLDFSIHLLEPNSPQLRTITEEFNKMRARVNLLRHFRPSDTDFLKAREVLGGVNVRAEQAEQGQKTDYDGIISLFKSVHQSLDSVAKRMFIGFSKEISQLTVEIERLRTQVSATNDQAQKTNYPHKLEMSQREGLVKELEDLVKRRNENELSSISEKIDQLKNYIADDQKQYTEFANRLEGFRLLNQKIEDRIASLETLKKNGPTAAMVAESWIKQLVGRVDHLREREKNVQLQIEKERNELDNLNKLNDANFKLAVRSELEKSQSKIEEDLQLWVISYISRGLLGKAFDIFKGNADLVRAKGDYIYGITKLIAEVDKAVALNKWLRQASKGSEVSALPPDEAFQAAVKLSSELKKTMQTEEPSLSAEKLTTLFDCYKKIGKINIDLQTSLETAEQPTANLEAISKNFALLEALQERIGVLSPLVTEHTVNDYMDFQKYCLTTWEKISQRPGIAPERLEHDLKGRNELLSSFIQQLWSSWRPDDPNKKITSEAFEKLNSRIQCQCIAEVKAGI